MQKHDFDTAVKFANPEQLLDRVGTASPKYHVQGVHAAGLQLAPLIYAGVWHSGYQNYTIFVVHTVSFVFFGVELTTPGSIHWRQKYPKMTLFGTRFGEPRGILPHSGTNHSHKPYIDGLQILSSLCMPRHFFDRPNPVEQLFWCGKFDCTECQSHAFACSN